MLVLYGSSMSSIAIWYGCLEDCYPLPIHAKMLMLKRVDLRWSLQHNDRLLTRHHMHNCQLTFSFKALERSILSFQTLQVCCVCCKTMESKHGGPQLFMLKRRCLASLGRTSVVLCLCGHRHHKVCKFCVGIASHDS